METQLLFGIIGLLVISIIAIWAYPRIKLLIIKKIYGNYSEKYIELYKRQTMKSPYSYCLKDDLINHIYKSVIRDKKLPFYKTTHEIKFSDISFFIEPAKVLVEKGEPDCANAFNLDGKEVKVLGFKSTIQGSSVRSLYFFLDNRFFMGQFTHKPTLQQTNNPAYNALLQKYINADKPEDKAFYIEGKQRRIFYENNGFNILIRYINFEDESITTLLEEYCRRFEGLANHGEENINDDWINKV